MTVPTAHSLRITRRVPVPPEVAFDAWTQPEHVKRWSCPEDAVVDDFTSDFRVGGRYRLRMTNNDGGFHTASGTYREIDRPNRVSYSWDWEEAESRMGVETIVTVTFEAVDGATEVTVVHEGFPGEEVKEGHHLGWNSCLDQYQRLFT